MLLSDFLLDLRSGNPSPEQLNKINKFRTIGSPEFTAEEIYSFPTLASDNLLHKNNSKWSLSTLETMARTFVGKDFLLNHDWGDSKEIQGIIYDSALISIKDLELSTKLSLTDSSSNPDADMQILTQEGCYEALILWVAVEASSPVASDIIYLRQSDLSIGGTINLDYICPLCNISFEDDNCPHIIPDPAYMYYMGINKNDPDLAPYYIRHGHFEGVELSMVVSGNCPRAKIIKQIDLDKLNLSRF